MLNKSAASTTIGISMDQEICLILGQVSFSLLFWKRNLQTDICGPRRNWQDGSWHPHQIIYGQNSGRNWEEMLSWGRSKKWSIEKTKLDNAWNLRGIFSSTLRTRKSKKRLRMLARNWKRPWLLLCLRPTSVLCWTVRNWSLFLTHRANWNKRVTSQMLNCSIWCGFWILKISCKIGVLNSPNLHCLAGFPTWQCCL